MGRFGAAGRGGEGGGYYGAGGGGNIGALPVTLSSGSSGVTSATSASEVSVTLSAKVGVQSSMSDFFTSSCVVKVSLDFFFYHQSKILVNDAVCRC